MSDNNDLGRSADAAGLSSDDRAPTGLAGSAASIPSAEDFVRIVVHARTLGEAEFDARYPALRGLDLHDFLSALIDIAQAIEARRAATGTGAVHESAVGNADAPKDHSHDH